MRRNNYLQVLCAILVLAIVWILFFFTSCTSKKTITMETAITLVIAKVGTGSITASWHGGSATDEELSRGIQVMPNTAITLHATTDSANVLWAYANSIGSGKVLPLLMQQNTTMNVAFYNLSFVNRVTIKKVHGVGMVQGSWHGGSSTDAELTKELTVPKGTRLKIMGISNSPKVVWNHDIQHPSDTISFFVLKDTVIEVGFYDPVVTVRKVHGTGTVSASWDAGAGTVTDAELAGEVVLPKGTQLTISGASASPKVVWNGDMQHPSKDMSFKVEKDTIIRVGFYDPIVTIEKIGGVGTVSGSWSNGKATDIELARGIELPAGTQINFTPTTKYYHTAWTYGKDATKADTANTSSFTITQDTTIKVNFFNIVYAAGCYTNSSGIGVGALWKNGEFYYVTNDSRKSEIFDIYVTNNEDVYLAGYAGDDLNNKLVATIWKNGNPEKLSNNLYGGTSAVQAIFFTDNGIYAAGSDGFRSAIWKDKQVQTIDAPKDGTAYDIFTLGNTVYAVGNTYDAHIVQATIWTNGKPYGLYKANSNYSSIAHGITIASNGDLYICGEAERKPVFWKNKNIQDTYLEGAGIGIAYKIYVYNDTVYVTGTNDGQAVVWKNGKLQSFSKSQPNNAIYDMCTWNNDIYMSGVLDNRAVVWINGKPQYLNIPNGATDSRAYSVFVK